MSTIRAIDLFCGAGGSSWGARNAGAEIIAGFDAWALAGESFLLNFPGAWFYEGRLEHQHPERIKRELGRVDLILASPVCTDHSPAKGNRHRCWRRKATALQVISFARVIKPRWIVVENVVNMRNWSRYDDFLNELHTLGYLTRSVVLNAKDFRVPQSRRRLFVLCDREREPSCPKSTADCAKPASTFIDRNGKYSYSALRAPQRAPATLARAGRAIATLGDRKAFLLVYYSSDRAGGWQRLDAPLRTITTLDRFALVKPTAKGHHMRMLQVPELKAAMGMPKRFKIVHQNRRDGIRLIGNAVCPPVMRAVVHSLTLEP